MGWCYLDAEKPDASPVAVPVSVGPSILHTESSGVRDGSASVISTSWLGGGLLRCFALKAFFVAEMFAKRKEKRFYKDERNYFKKFTRVKSFKERWKTGRILIKKEAEIFLRLNFLFISNIHYGSITGCYTIVVSLHPSFILGLRNCFDV